MCSCGHHSIWHLAGRCNFLGCECKNYDTSDNLRPTTSSPSSNNDSPRDNETEIAQVLEERGKRYGSFVTNGAISQELKQVVAKWDTGKLKPMQVEALDMIMQKIARILNGDPNYTDSWVDIAGYAQLIVNELEKKA